MVDEKSSENPPQRPPHNDPTTPIPHTTSESPTLPKKRQQPQKIPHSKEVWFPGTHSDIGGGNVVNGNLDRRHPSFLWMSFEAVWVGLKLDRSNVAWNWDELGLMRESLKLPWQILEYLPMKRLSYQSADSVTWWPHRGRGRKIQPGQKVHVSLAYCVRPYLPKALLPVGKGTLSAFVRPYKPEPEPEPEYYLPGLYQDNDLFELDIFDADATEHIMKMIESAADPTGGLHRLEIMLKQWARSTDDDADSSTKCLMEILSTCDEAFFKELLSYREQSKVSQGDFRNWSSVALEGVFNNGKPDTVRRHLIDAGILECVLSPLSDQTKRVRVLGIEFAARLAFDDEIRGRVDWEQCLAFLRDGLRDDDEEMRESSWRSIAYICASGVQSRADTSGVTTFKAALKYYLNLFTKL
ncbi:hypothetical protein BU17DRAFT_67176 [Hysterangium stoloniferum]|nr:hypothetical protein BU17DRAFT_67176 [Hysterangium stoloniferum]